MGVMNYGSDNTYPEAALRAWGINVHDRGFYHRNRETVRQINMNFVIRVYKFVNGTKVKTLVGGGMITKYMSEEAALKEYERVLTGDRDKYTWWDRNVLRIEFIAK